MSWRTQYWKKKLTMDEAVVRLPKIGLSNVYEMDVIEAADTVVMEVNDQVPWIHGDIQVHISQVDFAVEHSQLLPTIPQAQPGKIENQIASHHCSCSDIGKHGQCSSTGSGLGGDRVRSRTASRTNCNREGTQTNFHCPPGFSGSTQS